MSMPTTRDELALFMLHVLGPVATALEWDTVASFEEAVNETLIAYGVDAISDATDERKLRTLARREVWRAVMDATVAHVDVSLDGESFKRAQIHEQARRAFAMYAALAAQYDTLAAPVASVGRIDWQHDPYDHRTFDGRKQ